MKEEAQKYRLELAAQRLELVLHLVLFMFDYLHVGFTGVTLHTIRGPSQGAGPCHLCRAFPSSP